MRLTSILATAVAIALLGTVPASAVCNATCQYKCRMTSNNYDACVARWSKLNENPAKARKEEEKYRREHPNVHY